MQHLIYNYINKYIKPKTLTLFFCCRLARTTVNSGNANLLKNANVLLMCVYLSTPSELLFKKNAMFPL